MSKSKAKTTKLVKKADAKAKTKVKPKIEPKSKTNDKEIMQLPRRCGCGCGMETKSYFKMGHDGKLAGWLAKITKGKMELGDIPTPMGRRVVELYMETKPAITKVEAAQKYEAECKKATKKALGNVDKQLVEGESMLPEAAAA